MAWNRDTTLGTVSYDIVAVDKTKPGLDSAQVSVKGLTDNFFFLFNQITQTMNTLSGYGAQIYAFANDVLVLNSTFNRLHQTTTLSYQQLEEWRHVALMTEVDFNTLARTVGMFQVRIAETDKGTSKAGAALHQLGVETKNADGSLRPMNDVLLDVFGILGDMEPTMARNNLAAEIFGMRWQQIAPLLGHSREEIQGLINETPNLLSEADRQRANDFERQMKLINERFEVMHFQVGTQLMPAFKEWAKVLEGAFSESGIISKGIGWISRRLTEVALATNAYFAMWDRVVAEEAGNTDKITAAINRENHEKQMLYINTQRGYDAMVAADNAYHGIIPTINKAVKSEEDMASKTALTTEELEKQAEAVEDLRDKINDLYYKQSQEGVNQDSAEIAAKEARDKYEEIAKLVSETSSLGYGGAGVEYERVLHPGLNPVTGMKYSDMELTKLFYADVKKLKNEADVAQNKYNDTAKEAYDTARDINNAEKDLAKVLAGQNEEIINSATEMATELETIQTTQGETQAELARQAYQATLNYAADTIDWIGMHPAYQQIITVTDGTPNYVPPAYQPVDRLELAAAVIGTAGKTGSPANPIASGQPAKGGGQVTINNNLTVQGKISIPETQAALDKLSRKQGYQIINSGGSFT